MLLPFHLAARDDFDAVNRLILEQLHSDITLIENIGQHLIDAGGKRLRPLLVLLAARAHGYEGKDHITLAAIIEFIHTATLLHDDVVDTSDMRRGRATANARWGNAPSVLVGDFLYSRAFQMMVSLRNMDIMAILADTTNIISEGEVQQLVNTGNDQVRIEDYFSVIDKKTARLFEAAGQVGAIIAGASGDESAGLARYGHHLGMAFQLTDDALDYQGSADELGKNVGDDLAEGKPTLPLIHAMNHGTPEQAQLIKAAIRQGGLEHLHEVRNAIAATGAIEHTLAIARQHSEEAVAAISGLPAGSHKEALVALADFAHSRSY
ncbi:MAG: polyprenyl synthetase family protein [Porticoccaceae bacterium]